MALSDADLRGIAARQEPRVLLHHEVVKFARAIEAEVRKQDDELIRQMLEAMEGVKALNMGGELALWTAEFDRLLSAITAARARLEGKP